MVGRGWTLLQLIIVVLVPFYYCAPFFIFFLLACAIFMENQHMLWRVNKKNRWRRKHLLLYNFFVNPIRPLYFASPLLVDEFQTKIEEEVPRSPRFQCVFPRNIYSNCALCFLYHLKKTSLLPWNGLWLQPLANVHEWHSWRLSEQPASSDDFPHDKWASSQLVFIIFLSLPRNFLLLLCWY